MKKIVERCETRVLCLLLNSKLSVLRIAELSKEKHVLVVEHHGILRKVVACNLYKKQPTTNFDENETIQAWLKEGHNPILEEFLEDPLCILLSEQLTFIQMRMLMRAYQIIDVYHKSKQRQAIACVWYDPNQELEGRILKKELVGVR